MENGGRLLRNETKYELDAPINEAWTGFCDSHQKDELNPPGGGKSIRKESPTLKSLLQYEKPKEPLDNFGRKSGLRG